MGSNAIHIDSTYIFGNLSDQLLGDGVDIRAVNLDNVLKYRHLIRFQGKGAVTCCSASIFWISRIGGILRISIQIINHIRLRRYRSCTIFKFESKIRLFVDRFIGTSFGDLLRYSQIAGRNGGQVKANLAVRAACTTLQIEVIETVCGVIAETIVTIAVLHKQIVQLLCCISCFHKTVIQGSGFLCCLPFVNDNLTSSKINFTGCLVVDATHIQNQHTIYKQPDIIITSKTENHVLAADFSFCRLGKVKVDGHAEMIINRISGIAVYPSKRICSNLTGFKTIERQKLGSFCCSEFILISTLIERKLIPIRRSSRQFCKILIAVVVILATILQKKIFNIRIGSHIISRCKKRTQRFRCYRPHWEPIESQLSSYNIRINIFATCPVIIITRIRRRTAREHQSGFLPSRIPITSICLILQVKSRIVVKEIYRYTIRLYTLNCFRLCLRALFIVQLNTLIFIQSIIIIRCKAPTITGGIIGLNRSNLLPRIMLSISLCTYKGVPWNLELSIICIQINCLSIG